MPVNLPTYPGNHFLEYNEGVANGFGLGANCYAFDVWRSDEHLWRSYTLDESETLDSWYARNFPEIVAGNSGSVWGCRGLVPNAGAYPIPTRAGMSARTSLRTIERIGRAILAIAQLPHEPSNLDAVTKANTMRQRQHNAETDWSVFAIRDDDIFIRLLVAKAQPDLTEAQAEYEVDVMPDGRETIRVNHTGPDCDMADSTGRKSLSQGVKALVGWTGRHAVVTQSDEHKYLMRAQTINSSLEVRKVRVLPIPPPVSGGFDIRPLTKA